MQPKIIVTALAALAQESRMRVYRLLVESGPDGLSAGVISQRAEIPPSSLSFHLKELTQAGLVSSRQDGRFVYYSANCTRMREVLTYLTENCCTSALVTEQEKEES